MRANLLNLQKIYLGSCRIGQIDPSALRGLTNLIELDLGDNMLTDVPSEAFRDATSLRELRLNGNPIQKIEDRAFDLVPGLAKLDLSDCQIQTLAARAFQVQTAAIVHKRTPLIVITAIDKSQLNCYRLSLDNYPIAPYHNSLNIIH